MTESSAFAAIAEQLLPGCRLTAVRRLTGGVSASVHALDLERAGERRRVVVRAFAGVDWKPGHGRAAQLEHALLGTLHRAGLPVPEPLLLDTTGRSLSAPFLVMAFVEGSTEIPPQAEVERIDVMAATLAHLHTVPLTGLPGLPERVDPLPELLDYLPDTSAWAALRGALRGLGDTDFRGQRVLLHGDFWPGNLLWHEGRLAGIVDWEDAALGDPMVDLAGCRLELLWKLGAEAAQQLVDRYARLRPLDERRLALWSVFVARAAATFMGRWGLEPAQEAQMRTRGHALVRDAAVALFGDVALVPAVVPPP